MNKIKEVEFFVAENGKCYIEEWLETLDLITQARINNRFVRLQHGLYGDYKNIEGGLSELRFFFGSGYRVYFIEKNNKVILLLNGGDKKSQAKDIKQAQKIIKQIKI